MKSPLILIIDDDAGLRRTLSDILKVKGYESITAEDGGKGLALLRDNPVHVVLIDLGLPDMSGLDVLKKVKADYPSMEAIVLTGQATLDSAMEATNEGAYSYLVKPYEIDQLMLQIRRAFEKQQAEEKILTRNSELQQVNSELKALYDVSQAIGKTLDIGELATTVLQALVRTEVFPFEIRGAIFIDDKGEMRLVSFMGISETDVEPCNKIDRGQCLCGRAMATGKVVISQDSSEETGHEQCTHAGNAHGNIIIPLIAVGKTVGILSLYTKPGTEVTENLVKLFSILGGQIGIAINNAMFYEEIKNLSLHDPLTGLANRRFMEIQLEKDFEAARRYGGKLSVVMIDIDHFKQYNDTHGHQEGDRLLAKLAAVLLKMLRAMDTVFRYGGEEFLALLPGTDLAQAVATAERIRAAVEAQAGVTISLGVSEYGKTITDKGTLIKRADKALYRAKMGGRNRTESAEDEETSG